MRAYPIRFGMKRKTFSDRRSCLTAILFLFEMLRPMMKMLKLFFPAAGGDQGFQKRCRDRKILVLLLQVVDAVKKLWQR